MGCCFPFIPWGLHEDTGLRIDSGANTRMFERYLCVGMSVGFSFCAASIRATMHALHTNKTSFDESGRHIRVRRRDIYVFPALREMMITALTALGGCAFG